uniref:MSP domain-containing protein n=1 Tax=Trichogramma kaykai TaxID=54128 RepID=A0ABD2WYJ7_9HYME
MVQSPAVPVKLKESSQVPEPPPPKIILMAEPDIIEFRNCEANKTYKKILILHNISTWELARYQIEKLTNDSAFDVFEEPRDHTTIAPGISIRLIVEYRCDPLDEPEELLVVSVVNGKPVNVKLRATRDIPIITAKNPSCPGLSTNSSAEESSESTNVDTIDDSDSSNASYFSSSRTSTNTSHDTDSLMLIHASKEASLDCKTCFLGERTTIRNVLHSVGGKARFFIMSEMDWCSMSIKDVSVENILIVPPFAVQPAYFILEPDQQLQLDTSFYPRHSGLQVEKLIIVTDNCSVKTIEVIGNGLVFEARLLLFDRNVQYQWIQTRENTLCTISYLDLGSCYRHEKPKISFVLTSKCEVDLYYRWEIDNTLTCPKERANLLERKDFCPCNLRIQPSQGLLRIHKPVTFTLEADLSNSVPGRYRSNLRYQLSKYNDSYTSDRAFQLPCRLIIEDVPVASLPAKHNFSLRESQTKRRSCQKSVDIDFKNIDIRFECKALQTIQLAQDFSQYYNTTSNSAAEDDSGGFFFIMSSNLLDFVSNNEVKTKTFNDYLNSESSDEDEEDEVCGFLKGLGTCDCQPIEIIATAILRPPKPLYVAIEETFSVVLYNNSLKSVRYWWSPSVGLDHSRVKVKVSPKVNHMEPESSKIIKIKCLPMKTGGKLILLKQRLKEEVEIKSIISKSGDTKRSNRSSSMIDSSRSESRETVPDFTDDFQAEEDASSSATSTKVTSDNSSDTTTIDQRTRSLNSWYSTDKEEESFCSSQCYDTSLLTYVDVRARVMEEYYLNNGVIIDFNVTSEKSQRKQIFLINQSPLPSSFFVSTKNKWVENKAGNFLGDELRTAMSGVKIDIDPKNSQIKPHDTIAIDIIVSSHTWGVYVDQVTLYINLLPPFIFWIRITNDELPLCYPISNENASPLAGDPLVRFKVFNPGSAVPNQKILIENKSNIPLYVNWHCFALNAGPADEEKPFNLVLDMFSPFMDFDEHMETDSQFYDSVKQFFAHALNADAVGSAPIELSDMMYQLFPRAKKIHDTRDDSTSTLPIPAQRPNISQGTEFRLSLTPYFGESTPLFSLEVKCQIDENWIEKMSKNFRKCTGLCKIITKTLSVTFKEGFTQLVELPIKIYFPTIKVSCTCIDFGRVPMGSDKFLTFDVENISELRQTVDLKTTDSRNVFSYYPTQISLASSSFADKRFTQIEVTFHPT